MSEIAARRALRLLALSFGIAWIAIAMIAAPGPAAWVALSGDRADAGLFFMTFSLAIAVSAGIAGRAMDKWGRRPVLITAHLAAALGFLVCGLSRAAGALLPFIGGTVLLAGGIGAVYLTRIAAGEMFPPRERARAVGQVQVAATVGAVAGPLLLLASGPLARMTGGAAETLVWYLAPPLFLLSAFIVWRAPEPLQLAHKDAATIVATAAARAPARLPLLAGIAALVFAQGAMVAVMGVTGVALHDGGHGAFATAGVMALHFFGMFGFSRLVGRFADRAGRRATIALGCGIVMAGGAAIALLGTVVGLAVGLFLIGLGWSLAYIGGTVLIADVVPALQRARVVGGTDLGAALMAAGAAFGAGWWYAVHGAQGLGSVAIVLVLAPALLVLLMREPRPGHYHVVQPGERDEAEDVAAP